MAYNPNFRGSVSKASARQTTTGYLNGTGGTIPQATIVATNPAGALVFVDPSNETLVFSILGLTNTAIPPSANGLITDNGRLENITTSFSIGDAIYVASDGTLTNVKPNIGSGGFVAGDFIIFVGVIVKNEFNALQKDIKLLLSIVGQL